jgi:hypothetical protein
VADVLGVVAVGVEGGGGGGGGGGVGGEEEEEEEIWGGEGLVEYDCDPFSLHSLT